jgi:hypothetical protein
MLEANIADAQAKAAPGPTIRFARIKVATIDAAQSHFEYVERISL